MSPPSPRRGGLSGRSKGPEARDRGGLSTIDAALREFLKASGLDQKLRDWPVYEAWMKALGQDLARRARPVDFRRGELIVEVESSAHLSELRGFTGESFRRLANQHLGNERIRKVSYKLKR